MNWLALTQINQLDDIDRESELGSVLIFKHSTRCSISIAALNRIERDWIANLKVKTYCLDLLEHRSISNKIAEKYNVEHQSPQVLIIKNGKCVYNESHTGIRMLELENHF